MGIDIRNGQQMECITCALCIDACDDVMAKIGKPRGLIDYLALSDETRERAGEPPRPIRQHVFRPRTMLYFALWSLIGVGLVWALFARSPIDLTVAPVRNPTFVTLSDGSVRNTYDIRLRNQNNDPRPFEMSLAADAPLVLTLEGEDDLTVDLPPDETLLQRVYVTAPAGSVPATAARTDFRLWVEDATSGDRAHEDTFFNGSAR
jgi:polyferredoxin